MIDKSLILKIASNEKLLSEYVDFVNRMERLDRKKYLLYKDLYMENSPSDNDYYIADLEMDIDQKHMSIFNELDIWKHSNNLLEEEDYER